MADDPSSGDDVPVPRTTETQPAPVAGGGGMLQAPHLMGRDGTAMTRGRRGVLPAPDEDDEDGDEAYAHALQLAALEAELEAAEGGGRARHAAQVHYDAMQMLLAGSGSRDSVVGYRPRESSFETEEGNTVRVIPEVCVVRQSGTVPCLPSAPEQDLSDAALQGQLYKPLRAGLHNYLMCQRGVWVVQASPLNRYFQNMPPLGHLLASGKRLKAMELVDTKLDGAPIAKVPPPGVVDPDPGRWTQPDPHALDRPSLSPECLARDVPLLQERVPDTHICLDAAVAGALCAFTVWVQPTEKKAVQPCGLDVAFTVRLAALLCRYPVKGVRSVRRSDRKGWSDKWNTDDLDKDSLYLATDLSKAIGSRDMSAYPRLTLHVAGKFFPAYTPSGVVVHQPTHIELWKSLAKELLDYEANDCKVMARQIVEELLQHSGLPPLALRPVPTADKSSIILDHYALNNCIAKLEAHPLIHLRAQREVDPTWLVLKPASVMRGCLSSSGKKIKNEREPGDLGAQFPEGLCRISSLVTQSVDGNITPCDVALRALQWSANALATLSSQFYLDTLWKIAVHHLHLPEDPRVSQEVKEEEDAVPSSKKEQVDEVCQLHQLLPLLVEECYYSRRCAIRGQPVETATRSTLWCAVALLQLMGANPEKTMEDPFTSSLDHAAKTLVHAIELDPANPIAWFYVGFLVHYMNDLEERKEMSSDCGMGSNDFLAACVEATKGALRQVCEDVDDVLSIVCLSQSGRRDISRFCPRFVGLNTQQVVDVHIRRYYGHSAPPFPPRSARVASAFVEYVRSAQMEVKLPQW